MSLLRRGIKRKRDAIWDPISRNARIFETGEYSDMIVRCAGNDFKVHKAIVCAGCPFFAAAMRSGMKVGLKTIHTKLTNN